jgi:hypothetical protein
MPIFEGLDAFCDGEAPAGGGEGVSYRVVAPGGWLSVMGATVVCLTFFNTSAIL